MVILYFIGLCVAAGIIKYLLIPVVQAAKHGFIDGWNGSTKYKDLYNLYSDPPDILEDETIAGEIAHLKVLIDRNKQAATIIEKELKNTFDDKQRVILLSKLNNLDHKTFTYERKIDKLLEDMKQ